MSTEINMTDLLQATVDEGSSDLHIRVGIPPMLRIHGHLTPLDSPAIERCTRLTTAWPLPARVSAA